jgi:hypothetical protein
MRSALVAVSVLVAVGALGCGKTAGTAGDGATTTLDQSACTPARLGLPDAKPLAFWQPPETCTRKGGSGTATIKSEEELKAHFDCKGPVGIDFGKQSLVIAYRMMSPGSAGTNVLDDGQKVTLVNKFRSPCANDPLPMPAPYTLSFLVPAGSPRTFGEATCNVAQKCP